MSIERHNQEILRNLATWQKSPVLRRIYHEFHELVARQLADLPGHDVVELGSGIGKITDVISHCLRTDLFPNPWVDRVENAYRLSFQDGSISDLVLIDVFHHLRYPGTALQEFWRVLAPGGRVIIFDPCMSLLGVIVYGLFHPEPLRLMSRINWFAPPGWSPENVDYYAAQGNAMRIFHYNKYGDLLQDWKVLKYEKLAFIAYVASGGYSKSQLYPDNWYQAMKAIDRICQPLPGLFATRLLVVLEKKG